MDTIKAMLDQIPFTIYAEPDVCLLEGVTPTIISGRRFLEAELPDVAECPRCRGECYTFEVDERGYSHARPCPGHEVARRSWMFDLARLPAGRPYLTARVPSGWSDLVAQLTIPGRGWWLHGENGTGKTSLVVAVLRHLILDRGCRGRFCAVGDLLLDIRESYGSREKDQSEGHIIRDLGTVPVLVLDDIGRFEGSGDFEVRVLAQIVEYRANHAGLLTFVTSNPHPQALLESGTYGSGWSLKRIVRRLTDLAQPIEMK
jgi:hypothetical protein